MPLNNKQIRFKICGTAGDKTHTHTHTHTHTLYMCVCVCVCMYEVPVM